MKRLLTMAAVVLGFGCNGLAQTTLDLSKQAVCPAASGFAIYVVPPGTTGAKAQGQCAVLVFQTSPSATITTAALDQTKTPWQIVVTQPLPSTGGGPVINFADAVVPVGTIDGVNRAFTLPQTPVSGSEKVYRNGVRQKPGVDYALAGNTVTFASFSTPQPTDLLQVDYRF